MSESVTNADGAAEDQAPNEADEKINKSKSVTFDEREEGDAP